METVVRLVDESPNGERIEALTLRLVGPRPTVRDLIRSRVEAEAAIHNAADDDAPDLGRWEALVRPGPEGRYVDSETLLGIALAAFQRHGFFVLVDDRQVGSLDDEVPLHGNDTVSFLRVLPLVGP